MAIDYNAVKKLIRNRLLNTSAISSVVALKIFSQELALVRQPQFPSIAFAIREGKTNELWLKANFELAKKLK